MRTLMITPMLPALSESDRGGKHRRAGMFLRALARLSSSVEILYIVPERMMGLAEDQADLDRSQATFWGVDLTVSLLPRTSRQETAWNHYGLGIFNAAAQPKLYPYSGASLSHQVGRWLDAEPDCVFVDRMDAIIPVLGSGRRPRTLLFDMDDIYHTVLLRQLLRDPWRVGKVPLALHLPALILAEHRAVSMSALAFVCSSRDKAYLRRLGFGGALRVVPNAIMPPDAPPGVPPEPTLLFLGSQHHPPNREAAERLARRIWPMVRREVPEAHLAIAGTDCDSLPSRHAALPGVEYLGFVDDLDSLYARSRVVCTPIVHGSGTRLKLIEAAAFARPMVSTRMAAEGLEFRDGEEILLRDSDEDLAHACVALFRDDTLCKRLGTAARRAALSLYDVCVVERRIEEMIRVAANC